jgi:putative ABC transport system substrate-binding protein
MNPNFPTAEGQRKNIVEAAGRVGVRVSIVHARAESDFEAAFATLVEQRVDALMVTAHPMFNSRRAQIVALANQLKLPTIYEFRESATVGGLITYGVDIVDIYRQVGQYSARILKGTSPSELPVLQPTKFELVINLKTAKSFSITVPNTLLAIADEVIE